MTKYIDEIRDGSYDVSLIRQAITHLLVTASDELKCTSDGCYSWRINELAQCKFHVQSNGAIGGVYLIISGASDAAVVWL